MNLTIHLPDTDARALLAKAEAHGLTTEQYAQRVIERDLAPQWLRESWSSAEAAGLDQISMDEIDGEIRLVRKERRERRPRLGQ